MYSNSLVEWQQAERKLHQLLQGYALKGQFDVQTAIGVLFPLRQRYRNGERTRELFAAIMGFPS